MARRASFLFLVCGVAWGIPFYLVGQIVPVLGPTVTVFARMAVGALVLLPIAIRSGALTAALAQWRWVLLFALLQLAIPWWLVANAQQHLESGMTSLLMTAIPLLNIVFSQIGPHAETVSRRRVVGMALGVTGVSLLVLIDHSAGRIDVGAVFIVLLATCGYAVAPRIVGSRLSQVPSLGAVALALGLSALIWLVPASVDLPRSLPGARTLLAMATLGVICTAVAFIAFFELIKCIGPTRTSFLAFVNPSIAVVVGVVIGAEAFTSGMAMGIPLILVGTYLAVVVPRDDLPEVAELVR